MARRASDVFPLPQSDLGTIRKTLSLLIGPDQVVEMRLLDTPKKTQRGYYDDMDILARTAAGNSGKAPAVYMTLNPVTPALLARAHNRLEPWAKTTTADSDIAARRWVPLDFDPVRPSGISSSDQEHEDALARADACRQWLRSLGWPEPIMADSGNGAHLLYQIDLPNDSAARKLVETVLKAVAFRLDDDAVKVDQGVFNAARIWKVYGTLAAKGDNLPDRPHRLARLLNAPEELDIVTEEQLQALAHLLPESPKVEAKSHQGQGESFDLTRWIAEHGLQVRGPSDWNGGRKWILPTCPWNQDHNDGAAYLLQHPSGAISAGCHHNGCQGRDWYALRDLVEPDWKEKRQTRQKGSQARQQQPSDDGTDKPKRKRKAPPPTVDTAADLPEIQWLGGDLPVCVRQAEQALIANPGQEPIYQRGGMLVRVVRRSAVDVKGLKKAAGSLSVVPVEAPYLVRRFTEVAQWKKWDARAEDWRRINCPDLVARTYLSMVGEWEVPTLTAIIEAPTLRPDGSILDRPGYDPETGLLFDPGLTRFEPIPDNPSRDDALKALEEVKGLLAGFPFAAPHDEAVALSGILTALVRRSIKSAPLHGFTAPKMGSGKSLLADIQALIATGRPAAVLTHNADPAEEKKRLLSILMEGDPVVCIDNVEQPLGSDALCSILTQSSYKDRLLGQNRTIEVSTCATWSATGNNLCVTGDLSTRVLLCTLDPQCERPEERSFAVNLYEEIPRRRGVLVRAVLTILRAFHCANRPQQGIKPFGRFEEWSTLVRAALIWLGIDDPCKSRQALESADPIRAGLRNVLTAWHEEFGRETVRVRDVIAKAIKNQDLREALLDVAGARGEISSRRLGNWLSKYERRIEGGFRIESMEPYQGVTTWRVVVVEESGGFRGFRGSALAPHGKLSENNSPLCSDSSLGESETNPPNQPNPPTQVVEADPAAEPSPASEDLVKPDECQPSPPTVDEGLEDELMPGRNQHPAMLEQMQRDCDRLMDDCQRPLASRQQSDNVEEW